MKITGLDGKIYTWKLTTAPPRASCSSGHDRARKLLEQIYPHDRRLEEVFLPGSDGLSADFVLVSRSLLVEVHGRQHFEFVPHFHRNKAGFHQALYRDEQKRKWCELNGFRYVELPDDEDDDEWYRRIRSYVH